MTIMVFDQILRYPPTPLKIVIKVKLNKQIVIVSSIYRPPNTNQKEFIAQLKNLHEKIKIECRKEWVIGLDHNMDLLKCEKNSNTQDFLEFLIENELYLVITRSTTVTKNSATLINNIILS